MANDGIGDRVLRKEDKRFLTGRGRYTDDINVTGVHHAVFVRSPHAHAKIKSIDATEAKAAPGVAGVLTGADLAEDKSATSLRLADPLEGRLADEGRRSSRACQGSRPLRRRSRSRW